MNKRKQPNSLLYPQLTPAPEALLQTAPSRTCTATCAAEVRVQQRRKAKRTKHATMPNGRLDGTSDLRQRRGRRCNDADGQTSRLHASSRTSLPRKPEEQDNNVARTQRRRMWSPQGEPEGPHPATTQCLYLLPILFSLSKIEKGAGRGVAKQPRERSERTEPCSLSLFAVFLYLQSFSICFCQLPRLRRLPTCHTLRLQGSSQSNPIQSKD